MFGNNSRKKAFALMFAVTGIVLLMVSFILPWWGFHTEVERRNSDGDLLYYNEAGFGVSVSSGISWGRSGTSMYIGDFSTPVVYGVTTLFLILALIFASLMVTTIIINLLEKKTKQKLPMILGILAVIFCLLAPLVFMISLPGAMKADAEKTASDSNNDYKEPAQDDPTKSFFGSTEEKDDGGNDVTRSNWGGDIGWILSIVSFIMLLISVVMIKPRRAALPPSLVSPELSYQPESPPPRRELYDRGPRLKRYDRAPPPPPEDSEYDYRPPRERYI